MFDFEFFEDVVIFMLSWKHKQRGKSNYAFLGKQRGKLTSHNNYNEHFMCDKKQNESSCLSCLYLQ